MQNQSSGRVGLILGWTLVVLLLVTAGVLAVSAVNGAGSPSVTVEWQTGTEVGTVGFHLYRSTSETGPFERVTDELIASSQDPLTGGSYSYVDEDVVSGQTYYYQLEEIDNSGQATRQPTTVSVQAEGGAVWFYVGAGGVLIVAGLLVALLAWRGNQPPPPSA